MKYLLTIFAGMLQGITEFLPISSSGHLLLFHEILNFNLPDDLAFDAVLHLGTFFAILLFFQKEVRKYFLAFFSSFWHLNAQSPDEKISWYIFFATLPAALIGYYFEDAIAEYFRKSFWVAIMLIAFGVLLIVSEKISKKNRSFSDVSFLGAMRIGVLQAIAFIPGVSRSGITIIAGLWENLQLREAAKFSFLLSLPITLGAGLKKLFDVGFGFSGDSALLLIGFLSAGVSGYFTIRFFLSYLSGHSLKVFAYYRIFIGALILAALNFM